MVGSAHYWLHRAKNVDKAILFLRWQTLRYANANAKNVASYFFSTLPIFLAQSRHYAISKIGL